MGREFLSIFSEWANEYDQTVAGADQEYQEVFNKYLEMLATIAKNSGQSVMEFGSGTGNLTLALLQEGKYVYPVEPSLEMRELAQAKSGLQDVTFIEGDLENFPLPDRPIDTIVATFVFHHLTESEKARALQRYSELLPSGGKVIFGDTMFLSKEVFQREIHRAEKEEKAVLAADLQREYYPLIPDMENYFNEANFTTRFTQVNAFAWIVEATKV